jgi:hypothetical protein
MSQLGRSLQVTDIGKDIRRVCEADAVGTLRIVFGISALRCDICD